MHDHTCPRARAHRQTHEPKQDKPRHGFLYRWFWANSFVAGFFALLWLLLRSGTKPSRFAYPCQQAAISAATLAFGAPVIGAIVAARRGIAAGLRRPGGIAIAAFGMALTAGMWGYFAQADGYTGPVMNPPLGMRSTVFRVTDCPVAPIDDRFVGVDNLITLMGREGTKFYQSATESLTSGPTGILAADDTIVVKINYQWPERGGTNTDVLRGVIWRIVNHPDGFTGEVVVCENSQFNSINGFNRTSNNAEARGQSPHDVVVDMAALGYNVSHYDWTVRRYTSVTEYSAGNMTDGYIVYGYDGALHGRVSYPKFRTDFGTYISLKYGIWDVGTSTYDRDHLKFVNMPTLKSHHATYGATACVKHYMGVVSGELNTNSHSAIGYGILGAQLGEIQPADLNILDAVWINANPYDGPWTTYGGATRRDMLLASTDPVAIDLWAVKYILIPAFIERGYSPPWPYPSADPDIPTSSFRTYLDRSMNYILAAGYFATNDLGQIDLLEWDGLGDFDTDSDVDIDDYTAFASCYSGPFNPHPAGCEPGDFDGDGDVDCGDWDAFQVVWTGPGTVPPLPQCSGVIIPRPMADSAIDIAGTVRPCVTDEDCVVGLSADSEMACIPAPFDGGGPPTCYVKRNKYLSIDANPNSAGDDTARRVQLSTGETLGWVGPPQQMDIAGPETSPQWLSHLSDTAHYMDWTTVGTVHLGDCEISPGMTYEIQAIVSGSDEADEASYSQALVLGTVASYGDVVGGTVGTPPDTNRNFKDISAVVQGFQSTQSEPKVWLDLQGGTETPEVPDFSDISFSDINAAVAGFQGAVYPYAAPCDCPGQTCP